jgi:hypothetical protein
MEFLFDELDRTDDGPAGYAEQTFPYWNRSAREDIATVRRVIEKWFQRYPAEHRADLRARFRSSADVQHSGAFFELFLHELLLTLQCEVEIHPTIPGTSKRPEFRVTCPDGLQFYLEARVANDETKEEAAARKRANIVYDAINDLESPDYWINVDVRGEPASLVPTTRLKDFLRKRLATLEYDDIKRRYDQEGLDNLPRWRYEHDGWVVVFFPIPKETARGEVGIAPMGLQMSGVRSIEPAVSVRDAITEKAKRYGKPDLPLVIAVNALGDFVDDEHIFEALFGDEVWVSRFEGDPFRFARKPNGVWTRPEGQYKRVSAVLAFQKLRLWNFPVANVRLYHHPAAERPLAGPLLRLPQATVVNGRIEFTDGSSLSEILEIRFPWLSVA